MKKPFKRSMKSGNKKKPVGGKRVCIACQGSRVATNGSMCHPCKGTGYFFKHNMATIR